MFHHFLLIRHQLQKMTSSTTFYDGCNQNRHQTDKEYNESGGADNMINEYFKHCHIDCDNIIVDFLNIVL